MFNFEKVAKEIIKRYFRETFDIEIADDAILLNWRSKIIQNYKATYYVEKCYLGEAHYIEVTYNGNSNRMYLDDYTKRNNVCYQIN